MTVVIIRNGHIIVVEKIHVRGLTPAVEAYLYDLLPFYYRSKKAKAEVDRILAFVNKDFVSFIREVRV